MPYIDDIGHFLWEIMMQRILIVTGQSGAGKSTALQVLEDMGYYCIDNLPLSLLPDIVEKINHQHSIDFLALGVDVRNTQDDFNQMQNILQELKIEHSVGVLYLSAQSQELVSRFNLSRRPHPLSHRFSTLSECIRQEKILLEQIQEEVTLQIDTTGKNVHDIKQIILMKLGKSPQLSVIIQSFGFKYGIPLDTDFVYDVRHLPNPHWHTELRLLTGLDTAIQQFLERDTHVLEMIGDIEKNLRKWLPKLSKNNRHHVTISIGCTGGKHRSVYIAEQLKSRLSDAWQIQSFHREQEKW